ncbi:MAG: hypothetical protein MAG451_00599 [Anaerolineales bacterium]|nr:hypothetical protein [Anaerolineales bacterium]
MQPGRHPRQRALPQRWVVRTESGKRRQRCPRSPSTCDERNVRGPVHRSTGALQLHHQRRQSAGSGSRHRSRDVGQDLREPGAGTRARSRRGPAQSNRLLLHATPCRRLHVPRGANRVPGRRKRYRPRPHHHAARSPAGQPDDGCRARNAARSLLAGRGPGPESATAAGTRLRSGRRVRRLPGGVAANHDVGDRIAGLAPARRCRPRAAQLRLRSQEAHHRALSVRRRHPGPGDSDLQAAAVVEPGGGLRIAGRRLPGARYPTGAGPAQPSLQSPPGRQPLAAPVRAGGAIGHCPRPRDPRHR